MSEAEFDAYLSLLSKFLRLGPGQRASVADELRDHLEARLDELLAQGKTREQAIAAALDEFGDAALLASEFSRLASRRKWRFAVRCTAASAAVVAAVVLLSLALAPPGPVGPGPDEVVAQAPAGPPAGAQPTAPETSTAAASADRQAEAVLDRKLGQVLPEVKLQGVALRDAVKFVADAIDADLLIDEQALTEEGVSADDPARDLTLTRTPVSARTALELLLEDVNLTFVNRSGIVYVTTRTVGDEFLVTKVYNVRDLLEGATTHAAAAPMPGTAGIGLYSVSDAAAAGLLAAGVGQHFGGMGGGGMGGGFGGGMGGSTTQPPTGAVAELLQTIRQVTSGPWMETDGAGGTLTVFNGLLVVRHTDQVHAEIARLLDALRQAGRQEGGAVEVPKAAGGDAFDPFAAAVAGAPKKVIDDPGHTLIFYAPLPATKTFATKSPVVDVRTAGGRLADWRIGEGGKTVALIGLRPGTTTYELRLGDGRTIPVRLDIRADG